MMYFLFLVGWVVIGSLCVALLEEVSQEWIPLGLKVTMVAAAPITFMLACAMLAYAIGSKVFKKLRALWT